MEQPYQDRWSPLDWDRHPHPQLLGVRLAVGRSALVPVGRELATVVVCHRAQGTPVHTTLLTTLAPSSRRWAPAASLLVVNICHRFVDGTDWDYSEFAEYDLGQSVPT